MSEALIPVGQGMCPVNARDVHSFLEVGRDFPTWMRARLQGFREAYDYCCQLAPQNGGAASTAGGSNRVDYFLTVDMAKHICMIERNEKGKELRQWFIDRENRLAQVEQGSYQLPTYAEALRQLADSIEDNQSLKAHVAELKPKAEGYAHFLNTEDSYTVDEAAKHLGIGPRILWGVLKDKRHVFNRKHHGKGSVWVPSEKMLRAKYLDYKDSPYTDPEGVQHDGSKVYVTRKGLDWYRAGLISDGLIKQASLPLVSVPARRRPN